MSPFSLRACFTASALAGAALAFAPQAAPAAVFCNYDAGTGTVSVELAAPGDQARIKRLAGPDGAITVNESACGGATVTTTDLVKVIDSSGGSTIVRLDAQAGGFGPGATPEATGEAEIEFSLNLGAGFSDSLEIYGEASGASIAAGAERVNLNYHDEQFAPDYDVAVQGADNLVLQGSPAHDWISAQGGGDAGQPWAGDLSASAFGGDDVLLGGEGDNWLYGGAGGDVVIGGGGADFIGGGDGDDTLSGGAGASDAVTYIEAQRGVSVDLAQTAPQQTGAAGTDAIAGFEKLGGSPYDDVLRGTDGPEMLFGEDGDDVLAARGGGDLLEGDGGADTLRGGAGDDIGLGGPGADTAAYDDAPAPVTIDLGSSGTTQDSGGSGAETLLDVEGVTGSPFDDTLTGSNGPDTIAGAGGADTIDGREGADALGGGAGLDAIESRDSSADSISCGEGPDSISADPLDKLDPDCTPAPPPAPAGGDSGATGPTTPPPGGGAQQGGSLPPVLSVRVPRQSLRRVRAHGLRALLGCSATCTVSGRLRASRRTARRLGLGTSAKRRTLGRLAPLTLDAGATRGGRVVLGSRARRALRSVRSVRLELRLGAVDGAGRAAAPVRIAVRLR
jgi:Ca2+-binding RTX toxin-like protein